MKNKGSIIVVVIVCLLVGCVIWQQIKLGVIETRLREVESLRRDVQSALTGISAVNSTLAYLAVIESALGSNEKSRESTQSTMLMDYAFGLYYLAILDFDQSKSYLDKCKLAQDTLSLLSNTYDLLMDEKVALLGGEK